jgi:hypothetical protein
MILASYYSNMFQSILEYLQASVHMQKTQSVRSVHCGILCYLQRVGENN